MQPPENCFCPAGVKCRWPMRGRRSSSSQARPPASWPWLPAKALLKQPLNGSAAKAVAFGGQGVPAVPVQLGGCVHAAWSGANKYVRDCANGTDNKNVAVPKASASPSYVFRVNRDLVVLNDVNSGNVWLVNQNMQLVNNWDDVVPPKNQADDPDEESADDNTINVLPDRTKPNRPPETKPDAVGVRPGRTTVLSVLDNDSDPDGDVLTASLGGEGPAGRQHRKHLRRLRLPDHRAGRRRARDRDLRLHRRGRPRPVGRRQASA